MAAAATMDIGRLPHIAASIPAQIPMVPIKVLFFILYNFLSTRVD